MASFKDNKGGEWPVVLTISDVKRVRDRLDVDLLALGDPDAAPDKQLIARLMSDPVLLCDVIYCVCQPEAEVRGVSDEDFGRAMAGDAIDQATKALLEEIVNFTPSPRDRERARRVLGTVWTVIDKAQDLLDAKLADGDLERKLEEALSSLGSPSTGSPASSESTPDR